MTHTAPRHRPSRAYASAITPHLLLEPLEPRTLFSALPTTTPAQLVAQGNNTFAINLLHDLEKSNTGNIFFSPYSAATALEMALQGASGPTATEIIKTLGLPTADLAQAGIQALYQLFQANPTTAGYTLSTANQLWVNQNFQLLESFINNSQNTFGAAPDPLDFSDPQVAADTINAWASAQTHGKIPTIISPDAITELSTLIITNAVYFKANWASAFNTAATHDAYFQNTPIQTDVVSMMQQTNDFAYYAQSGPNGFQAVDLPYQNSDLDMLVILPTTNNLTQFQSTLTAGLLSQITSNFSDADVDLSLPKFTLNETYNLTGSIMDLGVHTAFTDGADFSGISTNPTKIDSIVQKTFIQIDETGTEAAAVTGIGMVQITAIEAGPPPQPVIFNADHPFLFAIRDRSTGTILFMGQITDPGADPNPTGTPTPIGTSALSSYPPGSPILLFPVLTGPITWPPPIFTLAAPIPSTPTPTTPLAAHPATKKSPFITIPFPTFFASNNPALFAAHAFPTTPPTFSPESLITTLNEILPPFQSHPFIVSV